jgi:hypothetical protein
VDEQFLWRLIWVDPRAPDAKLEFGVNEPDEAYGIAALLDAYLRFQEAAGILAPVDREPRARLEQLTADGDWVEVELDEPLIPADEDDEG